MKNLLIKVECGSSYCGDCRYECVRECPKCLLFNKDLKEVGDTEVGFVAVRCQECAEAGKSFMAEVRFYAEAMFNGVISFMERWAPTQGVPPLSEIWKAQQAIGDPNSPEPSPTSPEDKDE